MRLFFGLWLAFILLSLPAHAQTEPVPGDSCTGYPAGAVMRSGGPETGGMIFVMTCDAGIWKAAPANPVISAGCTAPGDECDDGTYYAGLTPDGNAPLYITGADAPGGEAYQWGQNAAYNFPGIDQPGLLNCANTSGSWPPVADTGGGCQTGQYNTGVLVAASDAGAPYEAAVYCDGLVAHGYDDWYLPSINEMSVLYDNLYDGGNPGQFQSPFHYWTSSEVSAQHVWIMRIDRDETIDENKNSELRVRCVRKGA